eukprot:gene7338-8736_t
MESKKPLSLLLVGKVVTFAPLSAWASISEPAAFAFWCVCNHIGLFGLVTTVVKVLSVNTRISDEEIQLFQELGTIFGRDWARWLVVVWTHVDQLTACRGATAERFSGVKHAGAIAQDDGTTLEEFLEGSPRQLLQLMTAAGGRSVAFDNRAADSSVKLKQISLLLAEADKVLRNNDDEPYTRCVQETM